MLSTLKLTKSFRTKWSQNRWIGGSVKSYLNRKGDAMGFKDRKPYAPILKNSLGHQVRKNLNLVFVNTFFLVTLASSKMSHNGRFM